MIKYWKRSYNETIDHGSLFSCWLEQRTQSSGPCHFLLVRLSLVRIVFLLTNQRKASTVGGILVFQTGVTTTDLTPAETVSLYADLTNEMLIMFIRLISFIW